jgi:hypothetical protein
MTRNKRRPGEGVVPMKIAAFDLWQEMHPTKPSAGLVSNRQTWQRLEPGWVKSISTILPKTHILLLYLGSHLF